MKRALLWLFSAAIVPIWGGEISDPTKLEKATYISAASQDTSVAGLHDSADVSRSGAVVQRATNKSVVASQKDTISQSQQTKKITIIKKDINYSLFLKLAVGMMFFIVLFYTSVQTWNPD